MGAPAAELTAGSARLRGRTAAAERWIAWVRVAAVAFAVIEVGLVTEQFPDRYETYAWIATSVLAVGAAVFLVLIYGRPHSPVIGLAALAFDVTIVTAFILIFSFEEGTPIRQLLIFPVVEAAIRFGIRGSFVVALAAVPILGLHEWLRVHRFEGGSYDLDHVTFPVGVMFLIGAIVGRLIDRLQAETLLADAERAEAERLRDEIGRRADQLEGVNRCSRALASTLDRDEAFRRFLREAETAFRFDRLSIALRQGDRMVVVANSGRVARTVIPPGTTVPIEGTLLARLADGETVVRDDMAADPTYREEPALVAGGLRSRVAVPILSGEERTVGALSISRVEPHAFSRDDIDLVTLLARQISSAIDNIRAYGAERQAAEELRRLSALRADFVSLVSHELRGPMASVIGCAATLRQRWRSLAGEQREQFLALIEEETSRLANLVGDVLDTSRLEAGTFSLSLAEVDVEELLRETAAMTALGNADVGIRTDVRGPLPRVDGDRDRLRQVIVNLLGNAVKYTVTGDEVELEARAENGRVVISVRDHGPGIPPEDHRLIFEKFGRATTTGPGKPGAGLGLYIARSIAEAHGGTLDVESQPGEGAAFVLRLPASTRPL